MTEKRGPLYPNQPLEEVATEIRFLGRLRVEQIRGDFQDAIAGKYARLYVPRVVPTTAPALQHFRFESDQDRCGVQLAVNSISVYAREYPGFEDFSAEVERLLEIFLKFVGPIDVTRVGWRYVNAIPLPRENGRLPFSRVFRNQPWLASALAGEWEGFAFTARTRLRDITANLRLAAGTDDDTAQLETLVFDIDTFATFSPPLAGASTKACFEHVKAAHSAAREIFELSINDDYRKFLLGSNT